MAIDVRSHGGELVETELPHGARRLGVRVKPILRLAMGHKDPDRGHPVKDDHFSPRGDDRAVAKFDAEYGEKPKAIEILLPTELDVALSIQYRAFKGAAGGEGGTLVAIGQTNFALHDFCGGLDVVTVFNQDGTVEEIETGLDADTREPLDDRARELGLELYTTLTAMMPGVLGFGSYFALTTKGKESTDNLWAKTRQLYSLFGSKVTFAVRPQLVIRSSKARPVVKKDGETKRITTTIYVADLVVPESIDDMIGRLRERQAALAPAGAAAALYGRELEPAVAAPNLRETPATDSGHGDDGGDRGGGPQPAAVAAAPEEEHVDDSEVEYEDEPPPAWDQVQMKGGRYVGKTISEIVEVDRSYVVDYLAVKVKDEEVRQAAQAWLATQSEAA